MFRGYQALRCSAWRRLNYFNLQLGGETKEVWQEMEEEKPCQEALEENTGDAGHDASLVIW